MTQSMWVFGLNVCFYILLYTSDYFILWDLTLYVLYYLPRNEGPPWRECGREGTMSYREQVYKNSKTEEALMLIKA